MDDLREIVEQDLRRVGPATFDLEQLATKREGVRRKRRVHAGIVGIVVVTALIGLLVTALRAGETSKPVTTPPARTNGWIVYTTSAVASRNRRASTWLVRARTRSGSS